MSDPAANAEIPGPRRLTAAGILGRIGVAGATFVLVGALLRSVAAPAGGAVIGGKLEYWRQHAREYDTVFLGSSHVLRAFVPSEFDRATAEFGVKTRSFNFGLQAVHLLEQRYLLREILAANPGVQRVFFEYQWLTPQIDPQNAFNARTVYWHDAETTRIAAERARHRGAELGDDFRYVDDGSHSIFNIALSPVPAGERAAEEHLEHWLTERLLIGRGKDVLKGLLGREHGQTARVGANQGYLSLEEDASELAAHGEAHNTYSARRERFLDHQVDYLRAVDRLDAEEQAFGDGEWVNGELARVDDFDLIASIARETRERGVEFVLVILPSQSCNRPFEERLSQELGSLVLRYNVPERYPALYDPDNRFDSGHLSADGALYFSRLLARDYAGRRATPADGCPEGEVPQ